MNEHMSLPVALAQLRQSINDTIDAHNRCMSDGDRMGDKLAASQILTSLRYIERHGLTDGGRRSLTTAIEATKAILGV